jgi:DNA-binding response OmpR family regulator
VRLGATLIDFRQQMAIAGDRSLSLTGREFELLRCLATRQGGVVSREELLESVWGCAPARSPRTIDNCMVRLRQKLEDDPHRPTFIRKAYGDGYRLVASEWVRCAVAAVIRDAVMILEVLLLIATPIQLTVV